MKKLPIGIQTFSEIREDDYIYIDKTKEAYELIEIFLLGINFDEEARNISEFEWERIE